MTKVDQNIKQGKKRCLVLSQGPVPTPEHKKVEGGGLRCWGLAKGIVANKPDVEITVAYHESYRQDSFTDTYEGIKLTTWNINSIGDLISGYDSVLVSYCMADLSVKVADFIRTDQQLILDCYVPIYVEVSARNTTNLEDEYGAFHHDVGRWAHVLRRGDIFLCASKSQKRYYQGVLSALGRINPVTYGEDLIQIVPYGIYREEPQVKSRPITDLIGDKEHYYKLLWFGGIYPWFDLRVLVDAVKHLSEEVPIKLVIVGAKNPFNDHPDFVKPYENLIDYIEENKLQDTVILKDWVSFNERADWYKDSDLVVVVNKLGEENELAWRTRLVDFMWANLPIITNGGDPLGEELISQGAAVRLSGLSGPAMAKDIKSVLVNTNQLKKISENLRETKKAFYWDVVTKHLTSQIESGLKARDLQEFGDKTVLINESMAKGKVVKIKKAISKARMIPTYAQKYGLRNTYYASMTKVGNQFKKIGFRRGTEPKVIMIAHQLDLSGAPYVFVDLAKAIKQSSRNLPLEFHTFNPSHRDNIRNLNTMGIKPKIHITKEIGFEFVNGDVIVLNTVAHSTPLKESIYAALENGTVKQLVWFIHEDEPELIFTSNEIKRLRKLLSNDKVIMFIAAQRALQNYQHTFQNKKNIRKQAYKYIVPERFQKVREPDDFKKLSFILPGSVADGRKGQLPILYSFGNFLHQYYSQNPDNYREFEVVYVGLGNDFLSRQIQRHAPNLLGDRFKDHGMVSHEHSSELIMGSNITICYSLRECLPLFVFEGMAAGHPILRNDSSGMEEQLIDGKNGIYLPSTDFNQITTVIERLLNKKTITNDQLSAMSKSSNKIALMQAKNSYQPMVDAITNKFSKN